MKLGIYVRSIGERTEKLCLESCRQCVPDKDIHLLKNYFPSYNVYKEMFKRAIKSDYDWYLGVDADVVLAPNWHEKFKKRLPRIEVEKVFQFLFPVYDPVYDEIVYRGFHLYNNKFSNIALGLLKKNILLSKLPWFLKKRIHSGYYLKPESSLRKRFKDKYGIGIDYSTEIVGIHGAEQFFSEVFRAFMVRASRNPEFAQRYNFLDIKKRVDLLHEEKMDQYVANLGWNFGFDQHLDKIDAKDIEQIFKQLKIHNIKERDSLELSLNDFHEKYLEAAVEARKVQEISEA